MMKKFFDSNKQTRVKESQESGTSVFLYQRLSAVALIFMGAWFIYVLFGQLPAAYYNVLAWIKKPLNTLSLFVLTTLMIFHGQLGLQVIVEDYIHQETVKSTMIRLLKLVSILLGILTLYLLVKIHQTPLPILAQSIMSFDLRGGST